MLTRTGDPTHKIGYQVLFRFTIGLHSRDELVLKSLVSYLGCGRYKKTSESVGEFIIGNLTEINEKIIPLFEKYPLKGAKLKDFEDFCKVADIKKVGGHLTELGLEQIRLIKMGMNRGRTRSQFLLATPIQITCFKLLGLTPCSCITYLNGIAPSNKTTLYRHIKSGKPYHGYLCE